MCPLGVAEQVCSVGGRFMLQPSFVVVEDCLFREFSLGTSFFRHYAVLVDLKYKNSSSGTHNSRLPRGSYTNNNLSGHTLGISKFVPWEPKIMEMPVRTPPDGANFHKLDVVIKFERIVQRSFALDYSVTIVSPDHSMFIW